MPYYWSCADCDYLDKSRVNWNDAHYCFQYGCSKRGNDKYICFWIRDDKELKSGGCSDYCKAEPYEQYSLFAI